jgi:hypothetical protein
VLHITVAPEVYTGEFLPRSLVEPRAT